MLFVDDFVVSNHTLSALWVFTYTFPKWTRCCSDQRNLGLSGLNWLPADVPSGSSTSSHLRTVISRGLTCPWKTSQRSLWVHPSPPTMFFRIYPAALFLHWRGSANSITRGNRNVVQTKVFWGHRGHFFPQEQTWTRISFWFRWDLGESFKLLK